MPGITPRYNVTTVGLSAGIRAALPYTKRTLPQVVNTAAYWICVNAKNNMPFVTPERVDRELMVVKTPVIGKSGKTLKNKFGVKASGTVTTKSGKQVPFAALIIAARAKPGSRYNQLTHGRYALDRNPFKGLTRGLGAQKMAALVETMTKARHSAGKFLVAGWIPAILKLKPLAVHKWMKGGPNPLGDAKSYHGANLGEATPAQEGFTAAAEILNAVGMDGANAESHNRALQLYGGPALQDAIDREGAQQMEYALKHMEAELAETVKPHWG